MKRLVRRHHSATVTFDHVAVEPFDRSKGDEQGQEGLGAGAEQIQTMGDRFMAANIADRSLGSGDEPFYDPLAVAEADAAVVENVEAESVRRPFEELQSDLLNLRQDIEHLRARLSVIVGQSEVAVRSHIEWADASAHAQLGNYPWLKLAGAMACTFTLVRIFQRVPLVSIVTTGLAVVTAARGDER